MTTPFDLRGFCDRRRFLAGVGGAAAAAATCGPWASPVRAAGTRWKMRLSCSSISFMRLPIEQACQRIAKLGFEAIDIWSAHAGCPHLDDALKRLGPDKLKALLAANNLRLCAFSVYVGGYAKYAELLGKAGGGLAIRGSAGPCNPKELTTRMRAFFTALRPEIDLAEKHDSYLAIENHGGALLNTLDSFKAFVEINRSRRVGIALAPYHLQAAKESVEQAIAICGKQLLFFYAWQNAAGTSQLPGIGPADCRPWLEALAKIRYPHYVNPFMHDEPEPEAMTAALRQSREYLKECYIKAVPAG